MGINYFCKDKSYFLEQMVHLDLKFQRFCYTVLDLKEYLNYLKYMNQNHHILYGNESTSRLQTILFLSKTEILFKFFFFSKFFGYCF